jgi:hypothetical protein
MNPLRVLFLLVAGLVLLFRGLQLYADRLTANERPRYAEAAEAAARAAAEAEGVVPVPGPTAVPTPIPTTAPPAPPAPPLPPATEAHVAALIDGDPPRVAATLRALRLHAITPDVAVALDAAQARTSAPDLQRLIACHRGRQDGATLDPVFAALPDAPPSHVVWDQEGTTCLVQVIAARAGEDHVRSTPVLVDRVLESANPAVLLALARLDLPELPARIADASEDRARPERRLAAVGAALAMGAAGKWPARVQAWLEDPDRDVRLQALRTVAAGPDEASLALAAEALAWEPGDDAVASVAATSLALGGGLDRALAGVAADPSQPPFARAHAAFLVSEAGGEAACRTVAAIGGGDATLAPELRAARARIVARFPAAPAAGAR